jgi:hypothetical protein
MHHTDGFSEVPPFEFILDSGYGKFRRMFHNTLCESIMSRELGLSEIRKYSELKDMGGFLYVDSLRALGYPVVEWVDQTPDIYKIIEDKLIVIEVSISRNARVAKQTKEFKYSKTFEYCESIGKQVEMKLFIWDGDKSKIEDLPGSELLADLFHMDHVLNTLGHSEESFIDFDNSVLCKNIDESYCENNKLKYCSRERDKMSDENYLENMARSIDIHLRDVDPGSIRVPRLNPVSSEKFKEAWNSSRFVSSGNLKPKKVLQLGFPVDVLEIGIEDKQIPLGKFEGGYGEKIDWEQQSKNQVLYLTKTERRKEEIEGPGRKRLMNREQIINERDPPFHLSYSANEEPLDDLISFLSTDPDSLGSSLNNLLRFYQRSSYEIILNSMEKRPKSTYRVFSSGFKDVWILLSPGALLRTEQNTLFIKFISMIPSYDSILSKKWHVTGNHYESDWISVDTERLKHWSRCFDRLILTFHTICIPLKTKTNNKEIVWKQEFSSGCFALMSLIFLEDKLLTSQTIECCRYFLMRSIGDKGVENLVGKLPQRTSSILQLRILKRLFKFCVKLVESKTSDFLKMETRSKETSEGSIVGRLPRIFTPGPEAPLSYILNEIYMGCLYNPDRQNKTQDAMKILEKVNDAKQKMDSELSGREGCLKYHHLIGDHTIMEDIKQCKLSKKEREFHYYSRKAIYIGSRIQQEKKTFDFIKIISKLMEKRLSEFATFKASVWDIKESVDKDDIECWRHLGERSKCIKMVSLLADLGNLKLSDVLTSELKANRGFLRVLIQIFKKNQWGGVREILILRMVARIIINFVEKLSTEICNSEEIEMLTTGANKQISMKKDHDDAVRSFPKSDRLTIIKNSDDMTRWCQKFIPMCFYPLLDRCDMPDVSKRIIKSVLYSHMEKVVEFPKNLVKEWLKYPEKKHENNLQDLKDKFLSDGTVSLVSKADMGQGILHFTSSLLAICQTNFALKLFDVWRVQNNLPIAISVKERRSSDDKGTIICINREEASCHIQYAAFLMCVEWSETLYSMELSVKAASGLFLYEFNSTFLMNTNALSPLIKFSLAACSTIRTDSFTEAVAESYSRIRQLYENGATTEIIAMAHSINKKHLEMVFGTYEDGPVSPENILMADRNLFPYDLGVYPIFDTNLQIMFGPEYYNYLRCHNPDSLEQVSKVYGKANLEELFDYKESEEDHVLESSFYKKTPLRIPVGFVSQLKSLRESVGFDFDLINNKLATDFLFTMRPESSVDELRIKIFMKLSGKGARMAMKRTSDAIYYGRSGAFRTGKVWGNFTENLTYSEVVESLKPSSDFDFNLWFPMIESYKSFTGIGKTSKIPRQSYFLRPSTLLLHHGFFGRNESFDDYFMGCLSLKHIDENKEIRFRKYMDFWFKNSFEFESYTKVEKIDSSSYIMALMNRFESLKTRKLKGLSATRSTSNTMDTYTSMVKWSSHQDYTYFVEGNFDQVQQEDFALSSADKIVLEKMNLYKISDVELSGMRRFLEYYEVPFEVNTTCEKSIVMMTYRCYESEIALQMIKEKRFLIEWYSLKQSWKYGSYTGDLIYSVSRSGTFFSILCFSGKYKINVHSYERGGFYQLLKLACKNLKIGIDEITQEQYIIKPNSLMIFGNKVIKTENEIYGPYRVLNQWTGPNKPLYPSGSSAKIEINEKLQYTISSDDYEVLNYKLKMNTSINHLNRESLTLSRENLISIHNMLNNKKDSDNSRGDTNSISEYDDDDEDGIEDMWNVELDQEFVDDVVRYVPDTEDIYVVDEETFEDIDVEEVTRGLSYKENAISALSFEKGIEEIIFRDFPQDNPSLISREMMLSKLKWLLENNKMKKAESEIERYKRMTEFLKEKIRKFKWSDEQPEFKEEDSGSESMDYLSEWILNLYSGFLGVNKNYLMDQLESVETESSPCFIIAHERGLEARSIRNLKGRLNN